jgi:hypothetical protein
VGAEVGEEAVGVDTAGVGVDARSRLQLEVKAKEARRSRAERAVGR